MRVCLAGCLCYVNILFQLQLPPQPRKMARGVIGSEVEFKAIALEWVGLFCLLICNIDALIMMLGLDIVNHLVDYE